VPQIRPLADIVHFKYPRTYLLTYLLHVLQQHQCNYADFFTLAPKSITSCCLHFLFSLIFWFS